MPSVAGKETNKEATPTIENAFTTEEVGARSAQETHSILRYHL